MVNYNDGSNFIQAYNNAQSISVLLELLEPAIIRIATSAYNKSGITDVSIGKEDVAQEVRLYLWKQLPKLIKLNISGEAVYKYCTTLIKGAAFRVLLSIKYINPRIKKARKLKAKNVSLSSIDLAALNYPASYPIDNLLSLFLKKCENIPSANLVFHHLTSEEGESIESLGLNPNVYAHIIKEMKLLIKEVAEEVSYA